MSLVSLYDPSAGKIREEKNLEEGEIDSTNSQTHTTHEANSASAEQHGQRVDRVEDATLEQLQKIRQLVREGMAEDIARAEVLGKGWVEP